MSELIGQGVPSESHVQEHHHNNEHMPPGDPHEPITKVDAYAMFGKWALSIMGTIVGATVVMMVQWNGLTARVDKLETWKTERTQPIEKYYQDQQEEARWKGRVEEQLKTIQATLEKLAK